MKPELSVEIYGIAWEGIEAGCAQRRCGQGGGCGHTGKCGGCCRQKADQLTEDKPIQTVGGMYRELQDQVRQSEFADRVTLRFIDLFEVDLEPYPLARELIAAGYEPPLIVFNGRLRYYGGMNPAAILSTIGEELTPVPAR